MKNPLNRYSKKRYFARNTSAIRVPSRRVCAEAFPYWRTSATSWARRYWRTARLSLECSHQYTILEILRRSGDSHPPAGISSGKTSVGTRYWICRTLWRAWGVLVLYFARTRSELQCKYSFRGTCGISSAAATSTWRSLRQWCGHHETRTRISRRSAEFRRSQMRSGPGASQRIFSVRGPWTAPATSSSAPRLFLRWKLTDKQVTMILRLSRGSRCCFPRGPQNQGPESDPQTASSRNVLTLKINWGL